MLFVYRIHFSKETVGVISQVIGIGEDGFHGHTPISHFLQNLMLLDQSIFQGGGVLVKNTRSLDAEVINDGGCFLT
jgi:hypothetical protein